MACFADHFWGEKNQGFDVLYHNMKHGQISARELADFVRERAAVEDAYAKSMVKMSKMAGGSSQLGTFAPLWEVFRISSDKLALCHAELVKKLHELAKEIGRYSEDQLRVHRKAKEDVARTLEAIQQLQGAAQHLPKAKEAFHSRRQELQRLRREGASQKETDKAEGKSRKAVEALRRTGEKYNAARADFEQKMLESAMHFQDLEESHLLQMKSLVGSYVHAVEDTHVQIGQVQEEFKQNMDNIGVETLLGSFAESRGTGCLPPGPLDLEELDVASLQEGPRRTRSKAFRIPGLGRKDREARESSEVAGGPSLVDEDGFTVRPEMNQNGEPTHRFCSSSDSDYDEEGPHKFYIRIKPIQGRDRAGSGAPSASVEQLKASVGSLILPPGVGGTMKRHSARYVKPFPSAAVETEPDSAAGAGEAGDAFGRVQQRPRLVSQTESRESRSRPELLPASELFGPPLESAFGNGGIPAPRGPHLLPSSPSPFSSSSPENVEDSGLDSPSHPAMGPSPESRLWSPRPATPQSPSSLRGLWDSPWTPEPTSLATEPDWTGSTPCWPPPVAWDLPSSPRGAPSPDPRPWAAWPHSPGAPRAGERDSCLSSNSASSSSSSPAPLSSGDSTSPSPWPPRTHESESRAPLGSEGPTEPTALPPATPMGAPARRGRPKRPLGVVASSQRPPSASPCPLTERAFFPATQPGLGISRGPSPVVLGMQGTLPVATAFTEYIHAYFKGQNPDSCLVKVTGELTMSFPAGIIRVFSSAPSPPVLSFRLRHKVPIEQFLPNTNLLFSDASQRDSGSKDFWLNMAALTGHLQKQAEQAVAAPYYNVTLLRYQFAKEGQAWAPLQLSVNWECTAETTRVTVDYRYNAAALASAVALTNVQVLLPVEDAAANLQPQPKACWNLEEKRLLWRLLDVPGTQGHGGSGRLLASWEPLNGPSKPAPVAAQFASEGSTISGAEVELVGSGYRMSLVKKRFATGIYLAGS